MNFPGPPPMTWFTARPAALAACAVALLASGCTPSPLVQCDFMPLVMGTAPPPPGARLEAAVPGTLQDIPLNAVSITDGGLRGRIMVQGVTATRTASGDIEVGARLFNCGDAPLLAEGRTNFLDAGQRPAEPASAWQRLVIEGRSFADYREVSVSRGRADAYLVELRSGS